MEGPSSRRFLDGLVHRPFTLGHRVGAVNPRQFRGFNRPALALVKWSSLRSRPQSSRTQYRSHCNLSAGPFSTKPYRLGPCQGLSALAARHPDHSHPSDLRRGCQAGGCLPVGSASSRRQLKDGSIGYECQHP